jgi:hypothetical protein
MDIEAPSASNREGIAQSDEPAETLSTNGIFSLANILSENHESIEHPGVRDKPEGGWDEEPVENTAAEGFCIECEGA